MGTDDEGYDPNKNLPPAPPLKDNRGRLQFKVHQQYSSHKAFKKQLIGYAVQEGFEYKIIKASHHRQTFKYRADDCKWRVHASTSPCGNFFIVKTLNDDHTCLTVRTNKSASSAWIAEVLDEDFRGESWFNSGYDEDKIERQTWINRVKQEQIVQG